MDERLAGSPRRAARHQTHSEAAGGDAPITVHATAPPGAGHIIKQKWTPSAPTK